MVKSAEAMEQLLLLTEMTSPDPTFQVLPGPAAQFTHVCYLPETVTLGKSTSFSLWGPAAGGGRGGADGHHLEQNECAWNSQHSGGEVNGNKVCQQRRWKHQTAMANTGGIPTTL